MSLISNNQQPSVLAQELIEARLARQANITTQSNTTQSLGRAQILARINNRVNHFFTEYVPTILQQGLEAAKEANLSEEKVSTIQRAIQTPSNTPQVRNYAEGQLISFVENQLKDRFGLDNKTLRTIKELIKKVKENGSFSPSDFTGDLEIQKVLNNPALLNTVVAALDNATDFFMNKGKELMASGSKKPRLMQRAQEALDIAELLISGTRAALVQRTRNEEFQFRGIGLSLNAVA